MLDDSEDPGGLAAAMGEWRAEALQEAVDEVLAAQPELTPAGLHALLVEQEEWADITMTEIERAFPAEQLSILFEDWKLKALTDEVLDLRRREPGVRSPARALERLHRRDEWAHVTFAEVECVWASGGELGACSSPRGGQRSGPGSAVDQELEAPIAPPAKQRPVLPAPAPEPLVRRQEPGGARVMRPWRTQEDHISYALSQSALEENVCRPALRAEALALLRRPPSTCSREELLLTPALARLPSPAGIPWPLEALPPGWATARAPPQVLSRRSDTSRLGYYSRQLQRPDDYARLVDQPVHNARLLAQRAEALARRAGASGAAAPPRLLAALPEGQEGRTCTRSAQPETRVAQLTTVCEDADERERKPNGTEAYCAPQEWLPPPVVESFAGFCSGCLAKGCRGRPLKACAHCREQRLTPRYFCCERCYIDSWNGTAKSGHNHRMWHALRRPGQPATRGGIAATLDHLLVALNNDYEMW